MQKPSLLLTCSATLFLTQTAFTPRAHAATCSMLSFVVHDARTQLKRAASAVDFDVAKSHARRARRALDDAAMAAMDCGCDMAHVEFDSASSRARRARDADELDEFVDSLNRAIREFNSGIDALRICSRR